MSRALHHCNAHQVSSCCCLAQTNHCCSEEMPFLSWSLVLMSQILACFTNLMVVTSRVFTKIHTSHRTRNARRKVLSSVAFSFPDHVAFREGQSQQDRRSSLLTEALGLGVTDVACFADVMGFTFRAFTSDTPQEEWALPCILPSGRVLPSVALPPR